MYHPTRKCGVLTDFDLTVFAWLTRIPGTDRTGALPFMALELLDDEYWKGNITRRYHHELEAFIWMLPFVFLAYDDGKFDRKAPFVVDWMTSDHNTCRDKKVGFANLKITPALALVKGAFKDYKALMAQTCHFLPRLYHVRQEQAMKRALHDTNRPVEPKDGGAAPPPYIEHCVAMWDAFIAIFSTLDIDVTRLRMHRPVFENAGNQDLYKELKAICDTSRLLAQRRAS